MGINKVIKILENKFKIIFKIYKLNSRLEKIFIGVVIYEGYYICILYGVFLLVW